MKKEGRYENPHGRWVRDEMVRAGALKLSGVSNGGPLVPSS